MIPTGTTKSYRDAYLVTPRAEARQDTSGGGLSFTTELLSFEFEDICTFTPT